MAFQEKQLGQLRPANTTAASIYSPGASTTGIIKTIMIVNNSGGTATATLYLDDDGTTYDATTMIAKHKFVAGTDYVSLNVYMPMNNSAGNLAVQTDTANEITFTVMGAVIS